ncbi:unnamed protein product [Orchesella dallaii]|uniref:DUF4789 domain-containing protein n=1 Tax=Orchesella dallaii TaxID=48710 RepID=A0ABP1RT47_9HEXA
MAIVMSNTCKWISCGVVSVGVILLLVFLYNISLENDICPNDGELMLNETGECFMKEKKGPCSNNLVFVEEKFRSKYGACSCPYMEFNRTLLYHGGQCYFVFSQAFCSEGYWLNVTKEGEIICELNPCFQKGELTGPERVQIKNGSCVQLGTWVTGCPEGSIVRFHKNYIRPSCHQHIALGESFGAISAPTIKNCPPGSYRALSGKCQPSYNFDFK